MKILEHLIQQLNSKVENNDRVNVFEFFPLLKNYSSEDWKAALEVDNGHPKTTVLFQDEQLKVILIYWDSFQKSKKHGHQNGGGLIKVLSGTVIESLFDPTDSDHMIGKQRYTAGNITFIHDDIAHHIVENPSRMPAVSLHIYSPAIYIPDFAPVNNTIPYEPLKLRTAA